MRFELVIIQSETLTKTTPSQVKAQMSLTLEQFFPPIFLLDKYNYSVYISAL